MWQLCLTERIFIFALLGCTSALTGPGTVHGFFGRSLSVTCQNEKGFQSYYKYWCKGPGWYSCTTVVKTNGAEAEVKSGRTSVKDNHTCSCFTVRLDNLGPKDAGNYWCAIERTGSDPGAPVEVRLEDLPSTTTIAVTTGIISTVHISNTTLVKKSRSPFRFDIKLILPIAFLGLIVVLLVGGLLMMRRLKKLKATTACGPSRPSTAPNRAECNVSDAALAANVRPNRKTPGPSSDQAVNGTFQVEYASVTRTPAHPTQPQVPSTNTEPISYATLKFSAQDEQAIYANL